MFNNSIHGQMNHAKNIYQLTAQLNKELMPVDDSTRESHINARISNGMPIIARPNCMNEYKLGLDASTGGVGLSDSAVIDPWFSLCIFSGFINLF